VSVTAAVVIMYCLAGLGLIGCCGLSLTATKVPSAAPGAVLWVLAATALGVGLINGVLGYQVYRGKRWARNATLALNWLVVAVSVVDFARGYSATCLGTVVYLVLICLLSTQPARAYFRRFG
jgi:hypothetical protein